MAEVQLNLDPSKALQSGNDIYQLLEKLDNKAFALQEKLESMRIRVPSAAQLKKKLKGLNAKAELRLAATNSGIQQDLNAIQAVLRNEHVTVKVKLKLDRGELAQLKSIAKSHDSSRAAETKADADAARRRATARGRDITAGDIDFKRREHFYAEQKPTKPYAQMSTGEKLGAIERARAEKGEDRVRAEAEKRQRSMVKRYSWVGGQLMRNIEGADLAGRQAAYVAEQRMKGSAAVGERMKREGRLQGLSIHRTGLENLAQWGARHPVDTRYMAARSRFDIQKELEAPARKRADMEERATAADRAAGEKHRRALLHKEFFETSDISAARVYDEQLKKHGEGFASALPDEQIARQEKAAAEDFFKKRNEQIEDIGKGYDKLHKAEKAGMRKKMVVVGGKDVDVDSLENRRQYGLSALTNKELQEDKKQGRLSAKQFKQEMDARRREGRGKPATAAAAMPKTLADSVDQAEKLRVIQGENKKTQDDFVDKMREGLTENKKRVAQEEKLHALLGKRLTRLQELENQARRAGRFDDADKMRDLQDETRRKVLASGDVQTQDMYDKASGRTRVTSAAGSFKGREDELKKYGKQVAALDKEVAKLDRRERRLNKRRSAALGGWFSKFSIYMSGIAATLFVWQELNQAISRAIGTGKAFSDTLSSVSTMALMTQQETNNFDSAMVNLARTIGGTPKEAAEAQKALMDIGASPAEQIQLLDRTVVIARSGIVDMAEAARQAKFDSYGMADGLYAVGKATEEGVNGPMGRAKGELALVMREFYRKSEPAMITFLNDFALWSRKEAPGIAAILDVMTASTMGLLEAMMALATPLTTVATHLSTARRLDDLVKSGKTSQGAATAAYRNKEGDRLAGIKADPAGTVDDNLVMYDETVAKIKKKKEELAAIEAGIYEAEKTVGGKLAEMVEQWKANWEGGGYAAQYTGEGDSPRVEQLKSEIRTNQELLKTLQQSQDDASKVLGYDVSAGTGFDPSADAKGIKEGLNVGPDPAKATLAWQDIYTKLGYMSQDYYNRLNKDNEIHSNMIRDNLIDKGWASAIKAIDDYHLEMKRLAPTMKALQGQFKFQGFLGEPEKKKYMDISMKQVEFEAASLKRQLGDGFDDEFYIKQRRRRIKGGLDKPTVDAHESIFKDTGIQTEFLEGKLKSRAKATWSDAIRKAQGDEQAKAEADKQYGLTLLEIDRQSYARRLEVAENFFAQTGKASGQFIEDQMALYASQREANIMMDMPVEEAERTYRAQVNAFKTQLIEPEISLHDDLYSTTNRMTDAHFDLKQRRLDLWVEHMRDRLGMVPEIEEVAYKRSLEIQADKLRSSAEAWEGIRAGQIEVFLEVQSHAAVTADAYKGMVREMDSTAKRQFFDVMEGRFDTFKDHAISVFEAIRDAANEILYDSIKKMFMGSGSKDEGFLGLLIRGIGGASGASGGGGSDIVNPPKDTWGMHPDRSYDDGGWIREPVIGFGTKTGDTYSFAEKNPELVYNPVKGGKGQGGESNTLSIHVPVSVANGDSALAGRLQSEIEATVKTVLREEMA